MHARVTTISGDPAKVAAATEEAVTNAGAAIEATAGNRGFAILNQPDTGTVIGISLWESAEAAAASAESLAQQRDAVAAAAGGSASVETYQVAVSRRLAPSPAGGATRMLRLQISPDRIEEGIAMYRDDLLPTLTSAAGLCSAVLLIDRGTGRGLGATTWQDQAALDAAIPRLDDARNLVADKLGASFVAAELFTMVRSTAQLD